MDRPDVPPNAKWLGVLKTAIPTAVAISPRFSRKKNFTSSHSSCGVRYFFSCASIKTASP